MEYELDTTNELYHHGIKGMKWGIRRFQNKDGSLTNAGRRRLQKESDALKKEESIVKKRESTQRKIDKLEAKRKSLEERKKALEPVEEKTDSDATKPAKKKSISDMTDEELGYAITRARLEDTYRALRPEPVKKPSAMNQIVNDVLKPAAINSGRKLIEGAMDRAVKEILKDKVDPNSYETLKKTYDKLELQNKIKKAKYDLNKDLSNEINYENLLKKQQYEANEAKRAKEEREAKDREESAKQAEKDAKQAEKQAEKDAKKAEKDREKFERDMNDYYEYQKRYQESMNPDNSNPYRGKGNGDKWNVNPNEERGLALYNNSNSNTYQAKSVIDDYRSDTVTSLTTRSNVSRGKSTVDEYLDFILEDSNGNALLRYNSNDDYRYGR